MFRDPLPSDADDFTGPRLRVGPPGCGKSSWLFHHQRRHAGAEGALVLASGPTCRRWREALGPEARGLALHTPGGWVRQELTRWWEAIEAAGVLPPAASPRLPRFVPAPVAMALMHRLAGERDGPAAAERWRAWGQTLQQGLPLEGAMAAYRQWLLERRLLDAPLAQRLYHEVLLELAPYRDEASSRVRRLWADDVERFSPLAQALVTTLAHSAEGAWGAWTGESAPLEGWATEAAGPPAAPAGVVAVAGALAAGLRAGVPHAADSQGRVGLRLDFPAWRPMVRAAVDDAAALVATGVAPERIALVAPSVDTTLRVTLAAACERRALALEVPATPLAAVGAVQDVLTVARFCHPEWQAPPERQAELALLERVLGLNQVEAAASSVPESPLWGHISAYRPLPLPAALRWAADEVVKPKGAEARAIARLIALAEAFMPVAEAWGEPGPGFLASWTRMNPTLGSGEAPAMRLWGAEAFVREAPPADFVWLLDLGGSRWWPRLEPAGEEAADRHHLAWLLSDTLHHARVAVRAYACALDATGQDTLPELPSLASALEGRP